MAGEQGVRILITRPREDGDSLAAALDAHRIGSLIEPLMSVEFTGTGPLDLDGIQALIATSANGVRAFAGRDGRRDVRLCAVGEATARAAHAAGFARVETAGGDVDSLADLIIHTLDPNDGAVMHIAGSVTAGDLGGRLAAARFTYHRAVLYRMRPAGGLSAAARRALAEDGLAGVALYSPRSGAIFAELVKSHALDSACRRLSAYCLSAAVAKRVAHLSWARTLIAPRPEQSAMISIIVADRAANET